MCDGKITINLELLTMSAYWVGSTAMKLHSPGRHGFMPVVIIIIPTSFISQIIPKDTFLKLASCSDIFS